MNKSPIQNFAKWLKVHTCLARHRILGPYPIQLSEAQIAHIRQWAEAVTQINEVRVFGSRTMGCSTPRSDIDLAITTSYGNFVAIAKRQERLLSDQMGVKVYIGHFNSADDLTVRRYCNRRSVMLFTRAS